MEHLTLGERLRYARESAFDRLSTERRISQTALADQIGVQRQQISMIERGERDRLSNKRWLAVADYLQVNVVWLMFGRGEMLDGIDQPGAEPHHMPQQNLEPVHQQQNSAPDNTHNNNDDELLQTAALAQAISSQILTCAQNGLPWRGLIDALRQAVNKI